MRTLRRVKALLVTSACVGMLIPLQPLRADGSGEVRRTEPVRSMILDVGLQEGGVLAGTVLNSSGQIRTKSAVQLIHQQSGTGFKAMTDAQGRFQFQGLAGGIYRVSTADSTFVCRCWAPNTAPPSASQELLVVGDQLVHRAQQPLAEALFSTPTLVVLMIAAAIAIPIAVHNSRDSAS